MDTMSAMLIGKRARESGAKMKVFDWDAAAKILRDRKAKNAEAGLQGDLEWTGGAILSEGEIVPKESTYTYLASNWATPILVIDGEEIPCFTIKYSKKLNEHTYWPQSARKILKSKKSSK